MTGGGCRWAWWYASWEKRGETASWRIGSDVLTEMNWGTYVFMSRCGDEAIIGLAVTYI